MRRVEYRVPFVTTWARPGRGFVDVHVVGFNRDWLRRVRGLIVVDAAGIEYTAGLDEVAIYGERVGRWAARSFWGSWE